MPTTFALPTSDRRTAFAFYRDAWDCRPQVSSPEDGVPEPLRIALGEDCEVILISADGFSFFTGHEVTCDGTVECLISLDSAARWTRSSPRPSRAAPSWGLYRAIVADPDGHLWQLTCG